MSRSKLGPGVRIPSSPLAAAFAVAAFLLPACATRTLTVTSNPDGAEVYVDGEYVGLTPVKIPFRYGGEREVLLYRPRNVSKGETKSWRPHRMIVDTTNDAYDLPIVDLVTDVAGSKDEQSVHVAMKESNTRQLYAIDAGAWRAAVRARADTLRARAREFQLGALPTSQGRDPGPLESRPQSRPGLEPVER